MKKLKKILNELTTYEGYNLNDNVKDRLDKTLNLYLEELDNSYSRLKGKKAVYIMKRLSK